MLIGLLQLTDVLLVYKIIYNSPASPKIEFGTCYTLVPRPTRPDCHDKVGNCFEKSRNVIWKQRNNFFQKTKTESCFEKSRLMFSKQKSREMFWKMKIECSKKSRAIFWKQRSKEIFTKKKEKKFVQKM